MVGGAGEATDKGSVEIATTSAAPLPAELEAASPAVSPRADDRLLPIGAPPGILKNSADLAAGATAPPAPR
jgi:hypothetical protein